MAFQAYEKGAIFAAGVMLAEALNFSLEHDSGLQPVHTMQKGFAGMSPGSPMTKGSVSSAVPRAGVDLAYLDKMTAGNPIDFVCYARGKKIKFKGYITNLKESYGADKSAELSFDFAGAPAEESTLLATLSVHGGS
jgi:hypothetical protein